MGSANLTPITSHNAHGEKAPESFTIAERLQEEDIDAQSLPTGDHALYVSDDDLDANIRRMLNQSHYTEGLPQTAAEADGYTCFRPKDGMHPDSR